DERGQSRILPQGFAEESAQEHGPFKVAAREQRDRQAREKLEGHKSRNRIAGQAEKELSAGAPEDQRFTRANGHASKIKFRAEFREAPLHQIVLASRDTATQEHQV